MTRQRHSQRGEIAPANAGEARCDRWRCGGTVEHKTHDPPVNANARAAKAEDIAVAAAEAEHRATSSSSLPPGWQQATAPDGNVYYYQTATGVTQWAPPKLSDAELTA